MKVRPSSGIGQNNVTSGATFSATAAFLRLSKRTNQAIDREKNCTRKDSTPKYGRSKARSKASEERTTENKRKRILGGAAHARPEGAVSP